MAKKIEKIYPQDDKWMTENGFYPPYKETYNFTKTKEEKEKLKKVKNKAKFIGQSGNIRIDPTPGKLIIYRKSDGATISIKNCRLGEIDNVIVFHCGINQLNPWTNLLKYNWNGRDYLPNEKPYSRYAN